MGQELSMRFKFGTTSIRVNVPTWAAMKQDVRAKLRDKQGFALATINLDHLVKLQASSKFREAYAAQDMIVADGNPIVWMSRLARRPVELIPGSEAILPLAQIAAQENVGIALIGSTDESLNASANYLEREVPGLKVVCKIAPPFGFDPDGETASSIFNQITASDAGLCFIALGAPKQEIFAAAGRKNAPNVGFVSIGAGLDFFAGTQKRAPTWVRRLAVEWLWRAALNPRRLGMRYVKCLAILPGQTLRALALRFSRI